MLSMVPKRKMILVRKLIYAQGDLYLAFSYDVAAKTGVIDDTRAIKTAASYHLSNGTRLTGIFESISGVDMNSRIAYYLATSHKIDNTTLKFAYAMADSYDNSEDTSAIYYALGVSHQMAKNIEIYALYAGIHNDKKSLYGFVNAPTTSSNTNTAVMPGKDSRVISIGIKYNFSLKN